MFVNVRALLLGSLAVSVAVAACAANGSGGSGSSDGFGANGSGGSGSSSSNHGTTGSFTNGSGAGSAASTSTGKFTTTGSGSGGGIDPDAACGTVTQKAKGAQVDLYITLDKSNSMMGDKWTGATTGLHDFVNDASSAGLDIALNFLPIDASRGSPNSCDPNQYKTPVVAFGLLPGNASAIDQAMSNASPDGMSSPIYPALAGAVTAAFDQVQANPGHAGAVLLVTDGAPDGPTTCSGGINPNDPATVAQIAANALAFNPPVHTFVVGLEGVDATTANSIASAGGTNQAIIIGAGNVAMDFKNALAQVRGQTLPCTFDIPQMVANGDVDPSDVNVLYTPTGGPEAILPEDQQCTGKGWRYDDPSNPTKIIFCAKSCDDVHSDYGAQVQILLGCATVVK